MLQSLQERFGIPETVRFESGKGGLTRVSVTTPLATAEMYPHGAHVTHFQPAGQEPMLWVSSRSLYQPDKAIRGGVPICFPWFGPRAGEPSSPMHGFARVTEWNVESVTQSGGGEVELVFGLSNNEQTKKLWPHDFTVKYRVEVGVNLQLTLEVRNDGPEAFDFEEALHSYFAVGDVRKVAVTGLEGTTYIDKTDGLKQKPQGSEPVTITAEMDRVYLNTQSPCLLDDPATKRRIRIAKEGSHSTVVWNPWVAKAKAMTDFGDDEWAGMICIETCNVGEQRITLQPGDTHRMRAIIGNN